jgi:hypothetical protein
VEACSICFWLFYHFQKLNLPYTQVAAVDALSGMVRIDLLLLLLLLLLLRLLRGTIQSTLPFGAA